MILLLCHPSVKPHEAHQPPVQTASASGSSPGVTVKTTPGAKCSGRQTACQRSADGRVSDLCGRLHQLAQGLKEPLHDSMTGWHSAHSGPRLSHWPRSSRALAQRPDRSKGALLLFIKHLNKHCNAPSAPLPGLALFVEGTACRSSTLRRPAQEIAQRALTRKQERGKERRDIEGEG